MRITHAERTALRRRPERCLRISEDLRRAVKTSGIKQYLLARRVGVDRSVLSCWMNDITPVRPVDPRVIALGRLLNVPPTACFARRASTAPMTMRAMTRASRPTRSAPLRRSA